MNRLFAIALALIWAGLAAAQSGKTEREFRLDAAAVPAAATNFLDSAFGEVRRLKFYKDIGQDLTTLEAKFREGKARYSVEFDTTGRWLDTELEVPPGEVPREVWAKTCAAWADSFELYRVVRVQHHVGRGGERYYEVELRGRQDFEWSAYQARLGEAGRLLEQREIELSPGHLQRW